MRFLILFFLLPQAIFGQINKTDSLKQLLNNTSDQRKRISIFSQILANPSTTRLEADLYSVKSIEIAHEIGDSLLLADAYTERSIALMFSDELKEALDFTLRAISIFESQYDTAGIISSYAQLATIYSRQKNFSKSIEYNLKSLGLCLNRDDTLTTILTYHNLGEAYRLNQQYDSSKLFLENARDNLIKINQPIFFAHANGSLGLTEVSIGDTTAGKLKVNAAIETFNSFGDTYPTTTLLNELADINLQKNEFQSAIRNAKKSYHIAIRDHLSDQRITAADKLAKAYEGLNAWDSAYHYATLSQCYKDSLNLEKATLEMADMRTAYELSKQEATLERLRYTNRMRLLTLGLMAFGLILVAILTISLFKRNVHIRKINTQLDQQKQTLEENEVIISKSLEEKETLLKEIHHRVKNNLQIVSSLLSLQSASTHDEQSIAALNEGRNRVESIALIHQKLYSHEDISHIDIKSYIEQLSNIVLNTISPGTESRKQISLSIKSADLMLEMDVAVPLGLIVNELLTNSCKYAFPDSEKGQISISFSEADNPDFMVMSYSDNGIGLPSNFDIGQASSLGLRLVQILSRQLHGFTSIGNEAEVGALFHITFKKTDVK